MNITRSYLDKPSTIIIWFVAKALQFSAHLLEITLNRFNSFLVLNKTKFPISISFFSLISRVWSLIDKMTKSWVLGRINDRNQSFLALELQVRFYSRNIFVCHLVSWTYQNNNCHQQMVWFFCLIWANVGSISKNVGLKDRFLFSSQKKDIKVLIKFST